MVFRRELSSRAAAVPAVLAVVLLTACGPGGTAGDGKGPDPADRSSHAGHGDHGDATGDEHPGHEGVEHDLPEGFAEALGQVTTDRGAEILGDGLITAAEVGDLRQAQVDCLVEDGFDAGLAEGVLQVRAAPDGLDDDGVAQTVDGCLGDLRIVGPLEAATRAAS
ncbi:hypothetical protein M1843_01255 [Isoptericola sp. 4D.3]|uniref:Lipoprotein n=1 Tax=Isoptericola peretonis TaxID=2918523 RepID=A0ABT0IYP4_9MICO|nr:hypothetical protein [Isoptericola sp. 4D.3]